MNNPSTEDELQLNRRKFLQFAATASAATAEAFGIAMKTDALAQVIEPRSVRHNGDEGMPYPYHGG